MAKNTPLALLMEEYIDKYSNEGNDSNKKWKMKTNIMIIFKHTVIVLQLYKLIVLSIRHN